MKSRLVSYQLSEARSRKQYTHALKRLTNDDDEEESSVGELEDSYD